MQKLDSLGRATFHHIAPQGDVCPTNREIRWLKHIERHGPQSSVYLHELTSDTHRCQDTSLRQLQRLRAGGFLSLPPQQRATERAEFNPYIYDLTANARYWLEDRDLAEPTVRPTGHFWHSYMVSCITSSIEIAAISAGVRFIPAHKILAIKNSSLGIPLGNKLLIPDQLFALDYGGAFRAFVLELDQSTEPVTSTKARKSLDSTLTDYALLFERKLYRSHYGLKASLTCLHLFTGQVRATTFLEKLAGLPASVADANLIGSISTEQVARLRQRPDVGLFSGSWMRITGAVSIRTVTKELEQPVTEY